MKSRNNEQNHISMLVIRDTFLRSTENPRKELMYGNEEKENKITCEICQAAAKEESGFGRKVSEATESSPEKDNMRRLRNFFHYSGSFGPGTVYRWKCDAEEGNRTDTVWLHERGKGTGR